VDFSTDLDKKIAGNTFPADLGSQLILSGVIVCCVFWNPHEMFL
jgi:hypothetical protein